MSDKGSINIGDINFSWWNLNCTSYDPCEADPDYEPELFNLYRKIRNWGREGGHAICMNIRSSNEEWLLRNKENIHTEFFNILNLLYKDEYEKLWWIDDQIVNEELIYPEFNVDGVTEWYFDFGVYYKDDNILKLLIDVIGSREWQIKQRLQLV